MNVGDDARTRRKRGVRVVRGMAVAVAVLVLVIVLEAPGVGSAVLLRRAKCETCPPASYSGGSSPCHGHGGCGAGSCPTPPPGYSGPGYMPPGGNITYCTRCPRGTYQDKQGSTSCKTCAPGHGPNPMRDSCLPCNKGEVSSFALTNGVCVSCYELHYGYRSSTNQSECIPCEPGMMSLDAVSCSVCSRGFYWAPKKKTCRLPCPAGNFCTEATVPGTNDTYCNTCTACAPGSVQSKEGQYGCELCPVGTYQDLAGRVTCKGCSVGYVQLEKGGVTCVPCPAGSYCPDASTMRPCPKNRYCPGRSTKPHTCPTMFKATPRRCKPTGKLVAVITCLSVAVVAFAGVVFYRWHKARHKAQLERQALLRAQRQRRQPVYSGL